MKHMPEAGDRMSNLDRASEMDVRSSMHNVNHILKEPLKLLP